MKYENFLNQLDQYYIDHNYSNAYRKSDIIGHKEKLEIIDAGYKSFLSDLLSYFSERLEINSGLKILDIGCGTGEFTVQMNLLGHDVKGIDLHIPHLNLAKTLAVENDLEESIFIFNDTKRLPFEDNAFDLITSFSVFEHLDDETMEWIIPEMHRICKGFIYTLVPNPIKPIDDHTGLAFLGYMPRNIALKYIDLRGDKYKYLVSRTGEWDVYYRFLNKIKSIFADSLFEFGYMPDHLHYPSLKSIPPIHRIGKKFKIFGVSFFIGIPLFANTMIKAGRDKQYYYPYLNLATRIKK